MGEVWKERDTRLGRLVAVKVSKTGFSQRFEREARAVAALNHPHICTLYDVGPNYLVMEYVDRKPLQQLIPSKGVPLPHYVKDSDRVDSSLWRVSLAGGEEMQMVARIYRGSYAVKERGLYCSVSQASDSAGTIEFLARIRGSTRFSPGLTKGWNSACPCRPMAGTCCIRKIVVSRNLFSLRPSTATAVARVLPP
jgi:hypothetical protein